MSEENTAETAQTSDARHSRHPRVYMLELWSFVPYYVAALCLALEAQGVDVTLGSARYHLDRDYFRRAGVRRDKGLLDWGGSLQRNAPRRVFKLIEYGVNLALLLARFAVRPPDVLHVQYLPLIDKRLRVELWFLALVRQLGIPIVLTVHNLTNQDQAERNRDLYARVYRSADLLICHGQDAREQLVSSFGIAPSIIRVIPHGPLYTAVPACSVEDARLQLGLPLAAPIVLYAGSDQRIQGPAEPVARMEATAREWAKAPR